MPVRSVRRSIPPSLPVSSGGAVMNDLDEALAIPFVMDVSSCPDDQGVWVCRLEYIEIPGCVAMARNALDAFEDLERRRESYLSERVLRGEDVPHPRPALNS